jgi:Protein of unknown function (DUF2380)
MIRVLLAPLAIWLASAAAAVAGQKAAIFPFELIDVSLQGEYVGAQSGEAKRLLLATEELRNLAARDAGYEVVDLSALKAEIDKSGPFHKCDGCETGIARQAGAGVAVTGTVRKISNLVLVVHIYVRDVASGRVNKVHRVELRGNTDETWLRGVRRLVREHVTGG